AIIQGERDPYRLADLCDSRIQAPRQQVAESLEGTWQNELLFILKQQLEIHDALAAQVSQCDRQIETHLQTIQQKVIPEVTPMPAARRRNLVGLTPLEMRAGIHHSKVCTLSSFGSLSPVA